MSQKEDFNEMNERIQELKDIYYDTNHFESCKCRLLLKIGGLLAETNYLLKDIREKLK